ncbi:hypothetical protein VE01_04976 [Pseudogymnoascus verrucosus]|uniref:AA9 family lytic polysaccharide monooxygenase n=1 Tax=Pseudogymnoascus verrucosus TaxID=342668 RepID=A0A1B8GPL3_9PEZI|nr:uncharacterized protein VE01_04976 [Pseudogymnoascus verrucosus]OBT97750.2 hypothetical protein VE01_04976 [Pseudogymnoascus verrucosus]
MKSTTIISLIAALAAQQVAGHATFQDLWVDGVDEQSFCARLPQSNSPVSDVTSNDLRCNVGGATGVAGKCAVAAGSTVTVEMHQQPGDRSCANEAIGGDHFGPVLGYLSKVEDAATADGSAGWFKIYEDSWARGTGSNGAADYWGTKDMNLCCGRVNMKIPADIPAGDYLLRAEVVALHVAGSLGGAQLYMSCYQLTISGGGSASPSLIQLPGAYAATDPGIKVDIYQSLATYIAPGPTVYGGFTKSAGATCAGVESGTATGPAYEGGGGAAPTTNVGSGPTTAVPTTAAPTTMATSVVPTTGGAAPTSTAAPGGCKSPKYGQCGGQGWTGCTGCVDGSTCEAVSPPYYSQCT